MSGTTAWTLPGAQHDSFLENSIHTEQAETEIHNCHPLLEVTQLASDKSKMIKAVKAWPDFKQSSWGVVDAPNYVSMWGIGTPVDSTKYDGVAALAAMEGKLLNSVAFNFTRK